MKLLDDIIDMASDNKQANWSKLGSTTAPSVQADP